MIFEGKIVYSKEIEGIGLIQIRNFDIENDIEMLYRWVTNSYAKYWGMLDKSIEQVKESYQEIEDSSHHHTFIGLLNDKPIFLMEKYQASKDIIAQHYNAESNDFGMHILVAPVQKRIPKLTWHIFSTIIDYFFSLSCVERIVVEPDVNNDKIHVLNKKAGFVYQKEITLPYKKASLAICTKESYKKALEVLD